MKKILITILAIAYLATSSGAVLTMHYCMGSLYAVNFSQKNKCSKCGMKHEKKCCGQKVKVLKAQDAHDAFANAVSIHSPVAFLQTEYNRFYAASFIFNAPSSVCNHSPPPALPVSLNLLYCVFRI